MKPTDMISRVEALLRRWNETHSSLLSTGEIVMFETEDTRNTPEMIRHCKRRQSALDQQIQWTAEVIRDLQSLLSNGSK